VKKKNSHNTTNKKQSTKIDTKSEEKKKVSWDEYYDRRAYDRTPISTLTIEKWATELREWVDTPPFPTRLSQFYRSKHIGKDDFFRLCSKYPILKQAKDEVMQELGERMEEGAIQGDLVWNAVKHRLHQYFPEALAADMHHKEMRMDSGEQNQTRYIVETKYVDRSTGEEIR
jgi:hypothetical protein